MNNNSYVSTSDDHVKRTKRKQPQTLKVAVNPLPEPPDMDERLAKIYALLLEDYDPRTGGKRDGAA